MGSDESPRALGSQAVRPKQLDHVPEFAIAGPTVSVCGEDSVYAGVVELRCEQIRRPEANRPSAGHVLDRTHRLREHPLEFCQPIRVLDGEFADDEEDPASPVPDERLEDAAGARVQAVVSGDGIPSGSGSRSTQDLTLTNAHRRGECPLPMRSAAPTTRPQK